MVLTTDGVPPEQRTLGLLRARLGVVLGLLFLGGPISDLVDGDPAPVRVAAVLAGLAVFVVLYLSLLPPAAWLRRDARLAPAALALLPALAIAVLAAGAPSSFAALFVYFVAAVGMLLPERVAGAVVVGTAACLYRRYFGRGKKSRR